MTTDECPLTELPPAMCSHCRGLDDRVTEGLPTARRWIRAQRNGHCPSCDRRILVDDEIGATDHGWVCRRCAL